MKIQSKFKSLAIFIFFFFLLSVGSNQQIQAQSDNKTKKKGINAKLAGEIKSTLRAKENVWTLDKEVEYANIFALSFKLNEKKLIVEISEFGTVKEAVEKFAYTADPSKIAVNVPVKTERNFADQAMLRVTNLNGGSMINYVFRQGNYMVSIWSEEEEARRFAGHILAVIKN